MPTENRSSNTELATQHPQGRRERFQKWVIATKHPVLGYLDGTWLARGGDREGYADKYVQGLWVAFKEFAQPAPQPHPEPIAWMVGTAFWWTKEEAERDAAATGLPIVGLGPMTGAGEAEQLREVIKHSDDQIMRQSLRISNQRALLAERDALLRELLADDVPLRLAAKIETALSASTEPSAPGKQGAPLGAVRAPEIQDLLDRAATAIGQYGDSLLGRGQREDSVDLLDLEREVRDLEQQFKGAFAQPST